MAQSDYSRRFGPLHDFVQTTSDENAKREWGQGRGGRGKNVNVVIEHSAVLLSMVN